MAIPGIPAGGYKTIGQIDGTHVLRFHGKQSGLAIAIGLLVAATWHDHARAQAPTPQQQPSLTAQQRDFGGIVSFEVRGGQPAAWRVIDATRMLSITANLGDVKSTITHPATTTHGRLTPEQRADAGISDGLIRVAVGLEDLADIRADLARGLDSA